MRWLMRKGSKARAAAKARKARRRPGAPRWVRPTLLAAAVGGIVAVGVGGPVWLWQSGWIGRTAEDMRRAVIAQSGRLGLTVQEVQLEGRRHASRAEIIRAVGLRRGDAILGFDPAAVRRRLTDLPWIREASVERRLPDMVRVSIHERRPMALWQRDGRLVLVDELGVVITGRELGRFRHLVIIVGDDAPRHAPTLFAMLAGEPELASHVVAAVRVGGRRWDLKLRQGVRVELPEAEPYRAWRKLARLEAQHRLLARDIKTIDMRLPDRLIVEPGALGAQTRLKGRNT
jgi:cell division protein FtsQ